VENRTNGVTIIVEGNEAKINKFRDHILRSPPAASQIKSVEMKPGAVSGYKSFTIVQSKTTDDFITEISPDIAVCQECLEDLRSDKNRMGYPMINCTNCGPRFTIIEGLPYDRNKTSMREFEMCHNCESDYQDILNRRFHAQPVACNKCGPVYTYTDSEKSSTGFKEIIRIIADRINNGKAVALKGIGGYHLMCDALNNKTVEELRDKKHRDSKPFAVLFRDVGVLQEYCCTDKSELDELTSWRRPIVILKQKKKLAESVNCGLDSIGALLPYMPLHYMLFARLNTPAVVLTSGNLSDEPIITDDLMAIEKLMPVTGSVLTCNRKIVNRTDDSVIRIIDSKPVLIRRSRGYVPVPVDLDCDADGILALGAEQKNSFCIGRGNQAIMSQYIGDLKNLPAFDFFKDSIDRFASIFRFSPRLIACDLNPDYLSTKHAEDLSKKINCPVIRVQHHHAHIASCMVENHLDEKVIGISLDGTGYGDDGNIWGGEFFIADLKSYYRFAHFDYMPMPGGDRAVEEPWRMAFSFLYRYFGDSLDYARIDPFKNIRKEKLDLIRGMLDSGINSPLSSGAGRLFDAMSAICGLCSVSDFDSEAPMRLEAVINSSTDDCYPVGTAKNVVFAPMLKGVLDDLKHKDVSYISAKFHNTVVKAITDVSERMRGDSSLNRIVLSGGVFQNKYLLERLIFMLQTKKFEVFTHHLVPANDGGISLGQLIIANKIKGLCV
jgi:hydrogenase maturation protein HypF